jgi:lipopolysaccharide assembly outer membrane protein LptD (OstA)
LQTNIYKTLFFLISTFIGLTFAVAQNLPLKKSVTELKKTISDKEKPQIDTIKETDTIVIDSAKLPKSRLEDIVRDKAKDYKNYNFNTRKALLYNKAELYYQDIELKAGIIEIDYAKKLAYARGIKDSLGNYTQLPEFKQGQQESTQDSLIYNIENGKAIIYGLRTVFDDVIIDGDFVKRVNDSTMYINRAEFTTSPKKKRDYFIRTKKIKVVPGKKIVGGGSRLYLKDVPTPIFLPFLYVPLTKGRSSGILLPTWGDNNQGYFLQNGGYYFAINDYVDLAVTGDFYTNGSWGLRFDSSYRLRYKYNGRFSLRFENLISGQRGFDSFSKTNNFHLTWSHSQDTKSSPNARFSSSVNFGSSRFFRESLNELSSPRFLNNSFSSSISYFRNFENTPFSMNVAVTHTQNTNTEQISMSLPNLQVNMDRVYPFASKDGAKKNAIQKLGITYSMSLRNDVTTNDDQFLKPGMFDNARSGAKHDVSVSTNIKAFKYFTISPNANYSDIWYLKTIDKKWETDNNEVVIDTLNGFETFRQYSAGVSASTTIYGNFKFKKGRIRAIRHTLKPSISYNYTPDFSSYYSDVQNDVLGNTESFSKFDGGLFGSPNRNMSQSLSFNLRNTFEAKVVDRDSTKTELKKIKLLNNLNFSATYNIVADSLKWSPVRMTGSTKLFNKLNLNFSATLDPYAIDANGSKIDKFNINNGGSLFRLTNAGLTASYSISSKDFSKDSTAPKNNSSNDD